MALELGTVFNLLKQYSKDVRSTYPVFKVFLFGSYAKGNASNGSDIDVCFFLTTYGDKDWFDTSLDILNLTDKYIDYDIHPIVFLASDIDTNHPFANEVIRTGIEIE